MTSPAPDPADLSLRPLSLADAPEVLALMRRAEGGLGRLPDEMDPPWMEEALSGALQGGIALGAWDGSQLVGVIKASRMPSVQFQHVLWDLTVAVAPEAQGRGIGHKLFLELLAKASALTPRVERVELVVREGLTHAIRLYERVGFRQEGRFERRFRLPDGTYEADLPMALLMEQPVALQG
ncbi:GNAT family N-acetyltransferase [Brevundimonas sp.]|uniref:GNAT family N-acetyltransferase n=1 Tax=Brevundimonas sp. TaxID=1871086 RepID=UPI0027380004|nr:GNAT family N-acetyltransferase [Brevundimonas sp.]MDP3802681.1 GNAT family N-acetyltransferase [Brevundimonas sp.]